MTATDITELGIMPMLTEVLCGNFSEGSGSTTKRKEGETVRGMITSPVARRLYAANLLMAGYISTLGKKHADLHSEQEPVDHDCEAFNTKRARLSSRKQVIRNLLRQAIAEEHPQVVSNNAGIRDGWCLVDEGGEWDDIVPVRNESSIACNFITRVTSILSGTRPFVEVDDIEPVAAGEEIIGSLSDERVRCFWSLIHEIKDEFEGLQGSDRQAIGNMTVNEAIRLGMLEKNLKEMANITSSLFWCGVRDAVPEAMDQSVIGIRQAWAVVKCAPDKDEGEIEVIMTPMGSAIAMKVPIGKGFLESLMGMKL